MTPKTLGMPNGLPELYLLQFRLYLLQFQTLALHHHLLVLLGLPGPPHNLELTLRLVRFFFFTYYFAYDYSIDKKQKGKNSKTLEHRNKFYEVVSPIMPTSIRAWVQASKVVGEDFDQDQPAREGVNRGYVLPDPA